MGAPASAVSSTRAVFHTVSPSGMRPWSLALRQAACPALLRVRELIEEILQDELIVQRDPVRADVGYAWLDRPAAVHRTGHDLDDAQAAALVEAQGIQIVVGGDQPDPALSGGPGELDRGGQQGAADAPPGWTGVDAHDLEVRALDVVRQRAGQRAERVDGHQRG